jgi:hypothetical protein
VAIYRNICQIDVTSLRFAIPAEHGVDGLRELSIVRFINTACVNPDISQVVPSGLFSAEHDLSEPNFIADFTRPISQVLESDFIIFISPGMREYCIGGKVFDEILGQAEFAIICKVQEAHDRAGRRRG